VTENSHEAGPEPAATSRKAAWLDLRLPRMRKVGIACAVTLPAMWLLTRPRAGRTGPSLGALAIEEFLTYATILSGVIACVSAVLHLGSPRAALAARYSVLALCVVLGNGSLAIMGFWQNVSEGAGEPYSFAPALIAVSSLALVPALVASIGGAYQRH
jgi:hypothetical protein